ncbi:MAG TPA: 30S ribosomal protein S6 [Planctomycetota bacterium]|nr:30S ribosomal protein S6 [Planctomycetota bacterium]
MRLYEGMFILDDARCAEDYNGTVEKVHEILRQRGAEIVDSRKWEERKLAYPIRRHHRGVYALIHFNAPTEAIAAIERQVRLAADIVLRDMIIVDEDGTTMGPEKEAERSMAQRPAEPSEAPAPAEKPGAPAEVPGGGEGVVEEEPAKPGEGEEET